MLTGHVQGTARKGISCKISACKGSVCKAQPKGAFPCLIFTRLAKQGNVLARVFQKGHFLAIFSPDRLYLAYNLQPLQGNAMQCKG